MVTILIVAVFLCPLLTLFPSGETKSDFERSCGVIVVALKKKSHNISLHSEYSQSFSHRFFFLPALFFLGAILSLNQTFGPDSAV